MRKTQARTAERERQRAERQKQEKRRGQIVLLAIASVAILATVYFAYVAVSGPQKVTGVLGPHFAVNTDKIDLGDEPLGKTVRASFDVKNTGDGTLTLNTPQMPTVLKGC